MSKSARKPRFPESQAAPARREWTPRLVRAEESAVPRDPPRITTFCSNPDEMMRGDWVIWNAVLFQKLEEFLKKQDYIYKELLEKYGKGPFEIIGVRETSAGIVYTVSTIGKSRQTLNVDGQRWIHSSYFVKHVEK